MSILLRLGGGTRFAGLELGMFSQSCTVECWVRWLEFQECWAMH
jgi:hypothetical protein